jgi:hypothetical protein
MFMTGAGSSAASKLPNFRDLVLLTYKVIDGTAFAVFDSINPDSSDISAVDVSTLNFNQRAELKQFARGYYDVTLGMLERRFDGDGSTSNMVREAITDILRGASAVPAPLHTALVQVADRGGQTSIATTNFDLLLEEAAKALGKPVESYSLGAIPRPSRGRNFKGVLHIHGALDPVGGRLFDFIVTDQDFGEFYLRRRVVPDFVYDAARLFHIVLVGYSANDPPMRYLLSAVAADGSRFDDLKERYTFVGGPNPPDQVLQHEWMGRGITPIPYDEASGHFSLLSTLQAWARLSAHGDQAEVDKVLRSIVATPRSSSTDENKDLFDHLFRRADTGERGRLNGIVKAAGAEPGWLDAIIAISKDPDWAGA